MSSHPFLPVKSDVIFRLFFADERNEEFLIGFLKSVLRLPEDDYDEISIADPNLLREHAGDKLGIIDVKLYTKSRKVVHIEIQLSVTPETRERMVFYTAKLVTEQMASGDEYDVIRRVISIVITDEDLIRDSRKYHHRFTLYDPETPGNMEGNMEARPTGIELTDIIEINTLELRKLPKGADGTALYDWARFIAAESREELNMIENPQVKKAVVKFLELSADERARDLYERREKDRRDRASEMKWAREKGLQEGLQEGRREGVFDIARSALRMNMPMDDIIKLTGLNREDLDRLRGMN